MKFAPSFNIYDVPVSLLRHAQPGQWVYAGDKGAMGRFVGIKKNGIVVVSWKRTADSVKTLRQYAKA
jgi:hypothetical protein